jgi:hypothetical protein
MAENRRRLNWATLAAVAVAGSLLAGAILIMTALEDRVEQNREYTDSFGRATTVVVEVDSADVQIGVSTDERSTVRTRLHWNTRQPPYTAGLDGGILTVRLRGCGFRVFGAYCEASVTMTVPADVTLRVRADSGSVRVAGIQGPARLDADSGDLDVTGLGGPLSVRLDSGTLTGQGLTSTSVEVDLDSGDVDLQFNTAPASVQTRTDSGQIVIAVPTGTGPYGVKTHTDSGETRVEVPIVANAQYQIDANTDSGDITIRYQAV